MRRLALLFAILSLIAAACGGGEVASDSTTTTTAATTTTSTAPTTTTTTDPGFMVSSDDGRVTIDVTSDALATDPGITITALGPDHHPAELTGLGFTPWVYALEPGQLEFDGPVEISVSIPIEEAAPPGFEADLPLATLIVTSADGAGWQYLEDMVVTRTETDLVVSGLIDHFSRLAVVPEQIVLRSRFIELTPDRQMSLGFDWIWSNGVPLVAPTITSTGFVPFDDQSLSVDTVFADGVATLTCPPSVSTLVGDLEITALLESVSDVSGETGVVAAPTITTLQDQQATVTFAGGLELLCRPVITDDGSITIDLQVDHPGGATIIPGEDFKGGLSAIYMDLGLGLPPLFVGLIRDVDGDGQIGPNDVMYPPEATDIDEGVSTVVLPLFGFGDYFPYFLAGEPRGLETEVLVKDGATILLDGLTQEETAIPILGDVPFLARVFGDESRQSEETELVIFVTPRIIQQDE